MIKQVKALALIWQMFSCRRTVWTPVAFQPHQVQQVQSKKGRELSLGSPVSDADLSARELRFLRISGIFEVGVEQNKKNIPV